MSLTPKDRIDLTDEDIAISYDGFEFYNLMIGKFIKTRQEAKQLKKQILEDYEFREKYADLLKMLTKIEYQQDKLGDHVLAEFENYKELKDKAEKWKAWELFREKYWSDDFNKTYENMVKAIPKLESQVKELKEELTGFKHGHSNLLKVCNGYESELQKYKQFVESLKEYLNDCEINYKFKEVPIKEIKQLIEGLK
jgi:exonuclease VII small subunit